MNSSKAKNPAVLITGGSQRIGRAIALQLAACGYDIALHYNRSFKPAAATAREIQPYGVNCATFACDLNKAAEVKELIPRILKKFPSLSVLINNASIFERSTLKNGTLNDLERHWAINFRAPYILTQEFARQSRTGNIINILDTNVQQNKVTHTPYLLSKKALQDLTELAAIELAPQIRVNAIAPGLILPPKDKKNDYLQRLAKAIPLKRQGNPRNISQTVQFILENDYLTGQTIFVDGGEHLT